MPYQLINPDFSKCTFVVNIYDDDVGNIIHTELVRGFSNVKSKIKNIFNSLEYDENDVIPQEDYANFDSDIQYNNLQDNNFNKTNWSCWLPGKHRLIHVTKVTD